jgi:NAD(P)-dependent dehydrogenase (short-subunit alcohol dehydrogenase family)
VKPTGGTVPVFFNETTTMADDLKGKVALVTGASRGLGAASARKLAARGARVAINYFGSPHLAQRELERIRQAGGHADIFKADVRDDQQVANLVSQVEKKLGLIDILVINATGPQPLLAIEELTWRACLDQLEFFVKSPLLLVKAVVGQMKQRRSGRIINIGSEVFEKGVPAFSSYVSAKAAQLGLTRSWAMELAPWQITVNLIAPGWIPTERHAQEPQENKDAYAAAVPMQHMGVPDDVAEAVAFLASDAAGFITGQKLTVNGGNSLA